MDFSKIFTFDFEATVTEPVTPYMVSIVNLENTNINEIFTLNDGDVVKMLLQFFKDQTKNSKFYAHNLTYDYAIIRSWCYFNDNDPLIPEFNDFITPAHKILKSTLKFKSKKITLLDSLPLFLSPLKNVMKSFTNLEKGETPIYQRIEDVKITDKDISYCLNDSIGLALALKKRFEFGNQKMTLASDAKSIWKKIICEKFSKIKIETNLIPPLDQKDDEILRKAYKGGFCFLNKNFKDTIYKEIEIYDVNSMYPAMMLKSLPVGVPLYKKGEISTNSLYQLGIQRFSIKSAELKENKIPILNNDSTTFFGAIDYLTHVSEFEYDDKKTFILTLQEFELFKQSYHYEGLELLDGYLFKSKNDLFIDYINEFLQMKNSNDKTIKLMGKLFLNSLYGKFGENPKRYSRFIEFEDDIQKFYETDNFKFEKCGYLPIAIFITSYARIHLINSIYSVGFENFIYCDTDSIHCLKTDKVNNLDLNQSKLGSWKLENSDKKIIAAKYLSTKRYCLQFNDGSFKPVCTGLPPKKLSKIINSLDDFYQGKGIEIEKFRMGIGGYFPKKTIVTI